MIGSLDIDKLCFVMSDPRIEKFYSSVTAFAKFTQNK